MFLALVVLFLLMLPFAYDSSATFRYYARFYFYYGYVMVASVLLIPFMAYRPKEVDNLLWASSACRPISQLIGLRWTIYGAERLSTPAPCVIVANHQSSIDILGMFEMWHIMGRVTVVAKKELMFAGPFGMAAWLCDLIFIDRSDPVGAWEAISRAVDVMLPKKTKLWVFPEGTRRSTGSIHPFKKGAFHVAVANQLPIVPVVYSSYYFLDCDNKTFDPGEVIINVLPPVETVGLTEKDVESLAEKIRGQMTTAFETFHVPESVVNHVNCISMEEPDSTTPAEREYSVDDDVLCTLTRGDQMYLGSVVQVNRTLKKCLVRFMDDTETWCDFANMKFFGAGEQEPEVTCVVCKSSEPSLGNVLLSCACGRGYHQRCHQPHVSARDPLWRCRICTPKRIERVKPVVETAVAKTEEQCMQCRGKDPWTAQMAQCRRCNQWVHGSCMYEKRFILSADRFHVFICGGCNRGKELCCRLAMKWSDLVHLVLFNLNSMHHAKYHDLDSAILPYLSRHWSQLLLPSEIDTVKEGDRRSWVIRTLQSESKLFRSGREVKKRTTLWGLRVRGAPRAPRVFLPMRGQVDPSQLQARLVPPTERPLQNGHVNSSRKGEESDSGRSSTPPNPEIIVESSSEFHGLGLVKRSVPFPVVTDSSSAADARFRSHAVRRAARLLRRKNVVPAVVAPPTPRPSAVEKPRLSDSEEEALRSLVPNTIASYLSPIEPKTEVRKRPQRNLLEARLNSTENKLYKPSLPPPAESPKKSKKELKEGKLGPKRLVQKTLLETFKRRSDAADDSASSSDERIRAVVTTRQLSVKDIIVRNGVVMRRRKPKKIIILPIKRPAEPPPAPPPPLHPSLNANWRDTLFGTGIDYDLVRRALSPWHRVERGEKMTVVAKRTLTDGRVQVQLGELVHNSKPSCVQTLDNNS